MTQSRQLAAIMFTDIVGYTELMGRDSKKALDLIRISKEIQKPVVQKHQGHWLKELGDGVLIKFGTALDAVNCAIDIQKVARAELDGKLRIGIHSGDITIENDDVYGDGVNIASRLQSIADPGGIYISESIEKAIRGQSQVQVQYLGEIKLKNVDYGVRTYALQGVGLPIPDFKGEKELSGHWWAEVQRREVLRTTLSYLVLAFLLVLLWDQAQEWGLTLPAWSFAFLLAMLGIGLPLSIYFAWNYERSPEGFVKTTSLQSWQNPYKRAQRKPLTSNWFVIGLFVVLITLYAYPRLSSNEPSLNTGNSPKDNSIAVLYFDNMSGDPDQEYFSDGMTEEIIAHLSRIRGLDVRSRTSVLQYKTKRANMNLREIADELGVNTILEGSVRKAGDQIRVVAQLIDAETDEHLWSETFDEQLEDIFEVQGNIARRISEKFDIQLDAVNERRLEMPPTNNIMAYDLFLQAQSLGSTEWGIGKPMPRRDSAITILRKVLQMDPEFSRAYSMLSFFYSIKNQYVEYRKEWADSAIILAQAAIAYDPDNPFGYLSLANYYTRIAGDTKSAKKWFLKANEIDPTLGLDNLGWSYLFDRDYGNSFSYFQEAIRHSPAEVTAYFGLARLFWNLGLSDSAKVYLDKGKGISPELYLSNGPVSILVMDVYNLKEAEQYVRLANTADSSSMHYGLGILQLFSHNYESAMEHYLKTDYRDLDWGYLLQIEGLTDSAVSVLRHSIEYRSGLPTSDGWNAFDMARAYAALEDLPNFERYIRKAMESGWHEAFYLDNDPLLDKVRETAEFKEIKNEFKVRNQQLINEVNRARSK